jgi:hypothetical protein
MVKLGAPSNIYYKSDDKMLIQRSGGTGTERLNEGDEEKPDFFFNYFSLGMVSLAIQIKIGEMGQAQFLQTSSRIPIQFHSLHYLFAKGMAQRIEKYLFYKKHKEKIFIQKKIELKTGKWTVARRGESGK